MPTLGRSLRTSSGHTDSTSGAIRVIRDALRADAVIAVSFLTVAPAFAEAGELLRAELTAMDIGVSSGRAFFQFLPPF